MIYGVKSKLSMRYLNTFPTYSEARVCALKQRQVWTNATMEIYEVDETNIVSDTLIEELPPLKPTDYTKRANRYTKIRKKDIRPQKGGYKLTVDPKKIHHEEDEFFPESEAEFGFRKMIAAKKKRRLFRGVPVKPREVPITKKSLPGDKKRTIAIDFDGVIHKYSKGWHDGTAYDVPMEGAIEGLKKLMERYIIYIHSSRPAQEIQHWFGVHTDLGTEIIRDDVTFYTNENLIGISNRKLPAIYYIDDRALFFRNWADTLDKILNHS